MAQTHESAAYAARVRRPAAARRMTAVVASASLLGLGLLSGCGSLGQDPGAGDVPTSSGPDVAPTAMPSGTSEPTGSAGASAEPTASTAPDVVPAQLTILLDETGSGTTRETALTCVPTGGDHADPEAACAALAAVGAAAFAPPSRDEMCTEQYGGPQVATVVGTVDGTEVRARFSRTNGCEIGRWDALAAVLGISGGM